MTLVAIVDGIERLPGIGAKTALAIRVELGRIALLDVQVTLSLVCL
jgi:recombinational DNA repair protein RecR